MEKSVTFRDYVEIDEKKMKEKIIEGMFGTLLGVIFTALVVIATFALDPLFSVTIGILCVGFILLMIYEGISDMVREVTESKVIILKINGEDVTHND